MTRASAFAITAAVLIAAAGYAAWQPDPRAVPVPAAPRPSSPRPSSPRPSAPVLPAECYAEYPPGSRVPMELPAVDRGIPLGGGAFLPPLNGVRVADGIPPIRRDPRLAPPGPVVAKQVDLSGQEWWIHADGSQTSCCFASVTGPDGRERRIVSTQHGAAVPRGEGARRPAAGGR